MPTLRGGILACLVVLGAGSARAATFSFVYDADGTRIKSTDPSGTTVYPFGDDYEVRGGVVTKYVTSGPDLLAKRVGTRSYWMGSDHDASVTVIDDAAQAAVGRSSYRPFGDRISQTGQAESRGFTGQRHDGTHLIYLHARYYDPALGRLVSPDPRVPTSGAVSLNRYAYAYNDPVNHTDTQGLDEDPPSGEIIPSRGNNWLRQGRGWTLEFLFGDNTAMFYKPMTENPDPNARLWVASPVDLDRSAPMSRDLIKGYFPNPNNVTVVEPGAAAAPPPTPTPEPPSAPGVARAPVAPEPPPAAPAAAEAPGAARPGPSGRGLATGGAAVVSFGLHAYNDGLGPTTRETAKGLAVLGGAKTVQVGATRLAAREAAPVVLRTGARYTGVALGVGETVLSKAALPLAAADIGYQGGKAINHGIGYEGRRFLSAMAGYYFGDPNNAYDPQTHTDSVRDLGW
jgi:RHS repeat-associated protein